MQFVYPPGATPLEPSEADGLLLPITTQGALNEAEYQSILTTRIAYARKRLSIDAWLSITSLRNLHKDMFADVWIWAGSFRKTEKSIGVAPHQIQMQLQVLLENVLYRTNASSEGALIEILVHFHHQLVLIHPFVNGNGRHSRLATEILARLLKVPAPKWANEKELVGSGPARAAYLDALKSADRGSLKPLIELMYPDYSEM